MSTATEANKALVRDYLEQLYRGNDAVLAEVISTEFFADAPPSPESPGARYAAAFAPNRAAFPDLRITIDAIIAEGDLVALHTTLHGTHLGTFRGVPPTGRRVAFTVTVFRRVRDGKIVEGFSSWDWLSALEQLGAVVTVDGATVTPRNLPPRRPRGATD